MSPPSGRWKLSSAAALAACVLLFAGAAGAQGPPRTSVLLLPLRSHWTTQPLADAVTSALAESLSQGGYTVTTMLPDSAMLRLAVSEGWAPGEVLREGDLDSVRVELGVAVGADAALSGAVGEREGDVTLRLFVAGVVSRRETLVAVSVPLGPDLTSTAAGLADEAAQALTDDLLAEVQADPEGKRSAAAARQAAGRTALASGMYREAVLDFEAALLGDPRDLDALRGSAEARQALGDYSGAVVRMRSLATVSPTDAEIAVELGYAALLAGMPAQAEAAFLSAAERLGDDPRVVEGLALSARAQGKRERAQEFYQVLVGMLPGLGRTPEWLPGLLADSTEAVRLTPLPEDERWRALGRIYLAGGRPAEGIAALLVYHDQPDRAPYPDGQYLAIALALDDESEAVSRAAQGAMAAQAIGQLGAERAAEQLSQTHQRSEALATLAERIEVSSFLDPAHRYRVLAYNLLNQANFEGLMYLRTQDAERARRADLLRAAFRRSRGQAQALARELLGAESEG